MPSSERGSYSGKEKRLVNIFDVQETLHAAKVVARLVQVAEGLLSAGNLFQFTSDPNACMSSAIVL